MTTAGIASSSRREPMLALIVDRDEDTRQMYAEYLRLGDWRVDEAADGREALAKAIAQRPDVIITETRLPGINGLALCGLLRQDVATSGIPVVFVTGDAYASDVVQAKATGADAVLTKPCVPERLMAEIRRVIRDSTALQARAVASRGVADQMLQRAEAVLSRAVETTRRHSLKKAHRRGDTLNPARPPPSLVCPLCDRALAYQRSHIGGVSSKHAEQWDYFECVSGCGTFQYRARTRKLRKVE